MTRRSLTTRLEAVERRRGQGGWRPLVRRCRSTPIRRCSPVSRDVLEA